MFEIRASFGEVSIVSILQMLAEEVITKEEARCLLLDERT